MVISQHQTKVNLLFNLLNFFINALIGLVLPAYLVRSLGVSTYALIPISMSITSIMLVVTIAINGTLSRFLSINFEQNISEVNQTFSTSFYSLVALVLICAPLCVLFLVDPTRLLKIEGKDIASAKILFLTTIMAFILNAFGSLYNSIAFVKNRIDLRNISLLINRAGSAIIIFLLFVFGQISVEAYGTSILIATLLSLIYSRRVARKLYAELEVRLRSCRKENFKNLYKLGSWLMVNQIGVLLFLQTDILLINHVMGVAMSGIYGTLLQWSFFIRAIINTGAGVLGPVVLSLYSKGKIYELIEVTSFTTKLLGVISAIFSISLVFFSKEILRFWLGPEYEQYSNLLVLIVFHLGFNMAFGAIINLNIAYNKARIPGLVTIYCGLANVGMSIIFLKFTSLGLYGVALAGGLSLTVKNLIFTPIYAAKIMGISAKSYLRPVIPSLAISFFGLLVHFLIPLDNILQINSVWSLGVAMFTFISIVSLLSFFLLLNSREKEKVLEVMFKSKSTNGKECRV